MKCIFVFQVVIENTSQTVVLNQKVYGVIQIFLYFIYNLISLGYSGMTGPKAT